jgi:hypothetical protein
MTAIHKTFLEKIEEALGFVPEQGGELTQEQLDYIISQIPPTDISGKVDKETGKSLLAITEAAKIHSLGSDDQDLSGLQEKESGKDLSENDLTDGLKNNYDDAYSHSQIPHLQFSGTTKISVGLTTPVNPNIGDIWIDTN